MSKVGAGLDAQRIQRGGGTPTPSETLRRVLSNTLGDLSESVEIQPETEISLEGVGDRLPPVASETAGFTPEGEMLPLGERFGDVAAGVTRPEFTDWANTGSAIAPEYIKQRNFGPDNTQIKAPAVESPRNPIQDIFKRAKTTASMMDPTDKSTPTIRIRDTNVTSPGVKQEYTELNKRLQMAIDPVEVNQIETRRRELADVENRENTILGVYLDKLDAMTINPENGYAAPDQKFLATGAIATEHMLDGLFLGTSDERETVLMGAPDEEGNAQVRATADLVNPSDAAERVGREVAKWWGAEKSARDEPLTQQLNGQEAKDLGGAFLLSYAKANPNLVKIVKTKNDGSGNYIKDSDGSTVRLELTPEGAAVFDGNREVREAAMGHVIDPTTTPTPGPTGATAEIKPVFRKKKDIEGRGKDPAYASLDQIHESIENQNSIAHVVDDRRTRIVAATLLPALYAPIGDGSQMFGDTYGIGRNSFEVTRLEKKLINEMDDAQAFDEAVNIMGAKRKLASDDLMTLVRFRKRPNYLQMAMQPLTGRTQPIQSKFNPTSKKTVRFATRAKHPATIRDRNSMAGKAYRHIMALSFGQDAKLEKGRFADLEQNKDKYYKWGSILEDALNKVLPADQFENAANAIRSGRQLDPQMVQGLANFQRAISVDPELTELLRKKGEDAPMAIDALIDFKNFEDNMQAGKPHVTFVNGYVDGKTNGMANQGMMLGNRELAVRVGAVRGVESEDAVDGGDVRDLMASLIIKRLNTDGIQGIDSDKFAHDAGKYADLKKVLETLGTSRTINKQISMIFPYGKELNGFRDEIKALLPALRAENKELDTLMTSLNMDEEILDAATDNIIYTMFDIFGEDTFNTRGIMRSVGFMHALTDDLFSLRGPVGHRILLGDKRVREEPRSKSVVVVGKDKDMHGLRLQDSETYLSSAAPRRGMAAGHVRGRAAVIPTQAFDAATVIRTTTGKSWERLKEAAVNNEPYMYQVYDAYKVDVNSFFPVVQEANKNFVDLTTRDWNFVEEAQKEFSKLKNKFKRLMEADPDATHSMKGGKFDYIYDLMDPHMTVRESTATPNYTVMKVFLAAAHPINPKMKYDQNGYREMTKEELKNSTPNKVMEEYKKFISAEAGRLQNKILAVYNDNVSGGLKRVTSADFLNGNMAPKLISSRQALKIFELINAEIGLDKRLSNLTEKTNRNRAKLRAEINRDVSRGGWGALQFWAH